jgi:hypothetical protein
MPIPRLRGLPCSQAIGIYARSILPICAQRMQSNNPSRYHHSCVQGLGMDDRHPDQHDRRAETRIRPHARELFRGICEGFHRAQQP